MVEGAIEKWSVHDTMELQSKDNIIFPYLSIGQGRNKQLRDVLDAMCPQI